MKKNTTKILVLLLAFTLMQCQNEDNLNVKDSNSSTVAAQKWFSNYLTQGDNYALFDDLQYEWDKATTITLNDGSKAITVPVIEPFTNTTYTGKKLLYVYLMEDNNYKAVIFQFSQKKASQPIKDIQASLKNFDGTISIWDLKTGFLEGATFEDNLLKNELTTKPTFNRNLQLTVPVVLDEVIITAGRNSTPFSFPTTPSRPQFSNITPGNYSNSGAGKGTGRGGNQDKPDKTTDPVKAKDPCSKLKEQLADKAFKDQLDALKKNYSLKNETGFVQNINGGISNPGIGTDAAFPFTKDINNVGYMHTHINEYTDGEDLKRPIKIFSPKDVQQFLVFLSNATRQGRTLDDVYGGVTSSAGTYNLKFNGTFDLAKANSLVFDDAMLTKYIGYFNDEKDIEKAFLNFLQNEIGINGISLYKANDDGTFEQKTVNATTGEVTKTPCN